MTDDTGNTDTTTAAQDDADDDAGPVTGQQNGTGQPQRPEVPPEVRRALKAANKEAETLRLKLKEFEDRDKTEAQKLEERAAAAEKAATHAQSQLIRYQVAAEKGLPAELAARLQGTDARELAADADKLLELFAAKTGGAPAFNGGPRKTADAPADMNALIRGRTGRG